MGRSKEGATSFAIHLQFPEACFSALVIHLAFGFHEKSNALCLRLGLGSNPIADLPHWDLSASEAALLGLTLCLRLGLGSNTIADLPHGGLPASEGALLGLRLCLRLGLAIYAIAYFFVFVCV